MSAARAIHRTQERRVERERRRKVAGAIGATAIGTAVLAPGAAADTFTVTNLNDSGAPAGPREAFAGRSTMRTTTPVSTRSCSSRA